MTTHAEQAPKVVPEFSHLHRDETLHARLDDCLHEVVDDLVDWNPHASLQSCKTTVLLRALDWCDLDWQRLGELTSQTTYLQPETAARLSDLVLGASGSSSSAAAEDPALSTLLHQSLVRPDKLGRVLTNSIVNNKTCRRDTTTPSSSVAARSDVGGYDFTLCLGNGGSPADEVDAILAVDGLAAPRPFPNFDLKKYAHRCSVPISPPLSSAASASSSAADTVVVERRDPMFEGDTLEDDDDRRHVYAVRQLYGLVPVRPIREDRKKNARPEAVTVEEEEDDNRIVCRIVYRALVKAFGGCDDASGTVSSSLLLLEENEEVDPELYIEIEEGAANSMSEDETSSSSSSSDGRDFVEVDLIPSLAETYVRIMGRERVARLAQRLLEDKKKKNKKNSKPETRGRKRKVDDLADDSKMTTPAGGIGDDGGTTTTTGSSSSKKQKKKCVSKQEDSSSSKSGVKKPKQPKQKTAKRTDSTAAAENINYIYVWKSS